MQGTTRRKTKNH